MHSGYERRSNQRFTPSQDTFARFKHGRRAPHPGFSLSKEIQRFRRVRDISLSGAFIVDPHPPPAGRMLQLSFWLNGDEPFGVSARIRRAEVGQGMGVQFESMSEADSKQLHTYIAAARVRTL